MENLARKSYSAIWSLATGLIICIVIIASLCVSKTFSGLSALNFVELSVLCILILLCLVLLVFELKRPDVVLKKDGDVLHIYCKRKWQTVNVEDVTGVKLLFQGGRGYTPLSFGALIIGVKDKAYKIYNVADVKNAWVNVENIIKNN